MQTVNDPPVAVNNNSDSTNEGTVLTVAAAGVLTNDTDADPGIIRSPPLLVTGPRQRQAGVLNANGSFTYTPAANYNGADSFTYRANAFQRRQ